MRSGSGLVAGLLLVLASAAGVAQEIKLPRLKFAHVDWTAAIASLADADMPAAEGVSARLRPGQKRPVPPALARLNTIMSQHFPGLATSPVPVLMPFDVDALMRDQAAGTVDDSNERYLAGFHTAVLFYPGPAGYDAAFTVKTSDIAELSDVKFSDPIEVQISGSALLYELDAPNVAERQSATSLEPLYPGIRKLLFEHNLRYTFVHFGVPYIVSITCFDAGVSRYHLPTCRAADVVAQRFLRALHVVGGTPRNLNPEQPVPIERPAAVSNTFGYYGPGQLLSGTGFRERNGRVDYNVYSQIRFPLADAPAIARSEVYRRLYHEQTSEAGDQANPISPWRDNFCERRGFPVGQCPSGIGHQGQDIRPAPCKPIPPAEHCTQQADIVAVRDGVILRSPQREAAYLVVNSANEHIRFRYLHMNPAKMDADNLLSGRLVHEGEVIGQVSNFDKKLNGTSYHLHFDVQVPTKDGWVFVNPYMTLVMAYERLIDARGTELSDAKAVVVASTDPSTATGVDIPKARAESETSLSKHKRASRHSPHKGKARKQHVAKR
jgi:peptidase M23-like protein